MISFLPLSLVVTTLPLHLALKGGQAMHTLSGRPRGWVTDWVFYSWLTGFWPKPLSRGGFVRNQNQK